jgi:hypothetical protein
MHYIPPTFFDSKFARAFRWFVDNYTVSFVILSIGLVWSISAVMLLISIRH